jgi:hypothetical protein
VFEGNTGHFQDNKLLFVAELDSNTAGHSKQVPACNTHEQLLPPLQHQLQQAPNCFEHASDCRDHPSTHERLQMKLAQKGLLKQIAIPASFSFDTPMNE